MTDATARLEHAMQPLDVAGCIVDQRCCFKVALHSIHSQSSASDGGMVGGRDPVMPPMPRPHGSNSHPAGSMTSSDSRTATMTRRLHSMPHNTQAVLCDPERASPPRRVCTHACTLQTMLADQSDDKGACQCKLEPAASVSATVHVFEGHGADSCSAFTATVQMDKASSTVKGKLCLPVGPWWPSEFPMPGSGLPEAGAHATLNQTTIDVACGGITTQCGSSAWCS